MIKTRYVPGQIVRAYNVSFRRRIALLAGLLALLIVLMIWAIQVGSYELSIVTILRTLVGLEQGAQKIVVWSIRMPRIIAAVLAGCGLGLAGLGTQSLLKNPLASPFTLGISQGAAFGAAFAIVFLEAGAMQNSALVREGTNAFAVHRLSVVTLAAFMGAMTATCVILVLARLKKMSPESIILAGVALSSLFTSGTILVQYFATEIEIATVVFWTFGDVGRAGWTEVGLLSGVVLLVLVYFLFNQWNLNALTAGDDVARGVGVSVERLRLCGMFLAALVAALVTAFLGVIAFLGLLSPHIGRRLAGADHRLLVPFSCLIGALLLLAADTVGRVLVGSGTLPVGVLTSFMGAPLFLFLLLKGLNR